MTCRLFFVAMKILQGVTCIWLIAVVLGLGTAAYARDPAAGLVLVAAPRALGDLRAMLAPHAAGLVTRELDKDLVHLPQRDLEKHLLEADAIL